MKNMDPLNDNVTTLLNMSSDKFVSELWKDGELRDGGPNERGQCGISIFHVFLLLPVWHFIVFSFSLFSFLFLLSGLCALTSVLTLSKSHLSPPTLSSVRLPLFPSRHLLFRLASEVKNCQRAYFYQRFPILHSDSGDLTSFHFSRLLPAVCRT